MASLEDILQKVKISGQEDVTEAFKSIGESAKSVFESLEKASGAEIFGGIALAVAGLSTAIGLFVEETDKAIERTEALAQAMGTTGAAVEQAEAGFAKFGVSLDGTDRFLQRLALSIERDWSQISEGIRKAADNQEEALLGVQEAANNLAKAYQRVQDVAGRSGEVAVKNALSQRSAVLALSEAEDAAGGKKESAANAQEKLDLRVSQARQAFFDANQRAADEGAKQRQAEKDAQIGLRKARLESAQAEEKEHEELLKNPKEIMKALDALKEGGKSAASGLDLAEVSTKNIANAIKAAASPDGGTTAPSPWQALGEAMKLFGKASEEALPPSQRLAIVAGLMGGAARSAGGDLAKIVSVLNQGGPGFDKWVEGAKATEESFKKNAEAAAQFESSSSVLSNSFRRLKEDSAGALSPTFVKILDSINESITKSDGLLNQFGKTIGEIGHDFTGWSIAIDYVEELYNKLDKLSQLYLKTAGGAILGGVAGLVAAGPAGVVPGALIGGGIAGYKAQFGAGGIYPPREAASGTAAPKIDALGAAAAKAAAELGKIIGGRAPEGVRADLQPGGANYSPPQGTGFADGGFADDGPSATIDRQGDGQFKGHYAADIGVNDISLPMLVDTGATTVTLRQSDAAKAGIDISKLNFSQEISTAGGIQKGATTFLNKVSAGEVVRYGIEGLVLPDDLLSTDLLGMSFLNTLKSFTAKDGKLRFEGARGGRVRGPGTSTSDSIPARLSHGEFVIKTAAVNRYGAGLFHALNNMSLERFASGGLVPRVARLATGGSASVGRPLNLTIGDRTFRGLTAPENVAKSMIQHAIDTQVSTSGRKPSWYK